MWFKVSEPSSYQEGVELFLALVVVNLLIA